MDETPRSSQFAFVTDMFRVAIAASFLVEHRFDPQHNIEDWPEQQRHHIVVVILFYFLELSCASLHFDLAH